MASGRRGQAPALDGRRACAHNYNLDYSPSGQCLCAELGKMVADAYLGAYPKWNINISKHILNEYIWKMVKAHTSPREGGYTWVAHGWPLASCKPGWDKQHKAEGKGEGSSSCCKIFLIQNSAASIRVDGLVNFQLIWTGFKWARTIDPK